MELYLKSFLLSKGYRVDVLSKRKFGHNLGNLNDICCEEGLHLRQEYQEILRKIQDWENVIDARYLSIGVKKQIVTLALLATCHHLHYRIQESAYNAFPNTRRPDLPSISTEELRELDLPDII